MTTRLLATTHDPARIGDHVKRHMRSWPFMARISFAGQHYLYGADTNCTDAMIAARGDHPTGVDAAEIEYLSRERLEAVKRSAATNPLAEAIKRL